MNPFPLLISLLFLAAVPVDAALVLKFDPPALPHGSRGFDSYSEGGVIFSGTLSGSFSQTDTGLSDRPDDGSAHLDITRMFTQFRFLDNRTFSLNQLDVAEYSTVFASPKTISLNGVKADNSSVTFSFTTDGIIDGTGPLPDFQTVVIPPSFSNLQRVEFSSAGFSIDNVTLTSTPEPSTLHYGLLLMGALLLHRNRRQA